MKVIQGDGGPDRRLLTGMITDPTFLARVAARWDDRRGMFASPWCNLIAGWCVRHFRKFGEAPKKAVNSLYETWVNEGGRDEDVVAVIGSFLAGLSAEYERNGDGLNPDYLTDLAAGHFTKNLVSRLDEGIQADLEAGNLEQAVEKIRGFKAVEMGTGSTEDLLAGLDDVFDDTESDVLVRYPGPLGEFFGDLFERGGFVDFRGPTGRGKTFWLLDLAWRGCVQKRRVLFLEVGDMNRKQIRRRFASRMTRRPWKSTNKDHSWPCDVKFPTKIVPGKADQGVPPNITSEVKTFAGPLSRENIRSTRDRLREGHFKTDEPFLRLHVCPARSLSVFGMDDVVKRLQDEDWPPDIVVLDYADLLAPPPGIQELREKINETWVHLRRISEARHCLVVTASQSDAPSYTRRLLGLDNFTDDRRKNDHVTAVVGLNQTDEEKQLGVTRLNLPKRREDDAVVTRVVHVAGNLAVANPAMCSAF